MQMNAATVLNETLKDIAHAAYICGGSFSPKMMGIVRASTEAYAFVEADCSNFPANGHEREKIVEQALRHLIDLPGLLAVGYMAEAHMVKVSEAVTQRPALSEIAEEKQEVLFITVKTREQMTTSVFALNTHGSKIKMEENPIWISEST